MQMKDLREFLQLESVGGIILFLTAVVAIILANSPLSSFYQQIIQQPLHIQLGTMKMVEPLMFWVNEGLMTLFFLLVGLELKREMVLGELSRLSEMILPAVAAFGGMIIPALFYTGINYADPITLKGWAVPVATDIAFALGVLSLFGKRIPIGLKLFLMALAVFDDIGAILIIALFYTQKLSLIYLSFSGLLLIGLIGLNYSGVRSLFFYLVMGFLLWICVLKSGVHPTVAGVLLALVIPANQQINEQSSPLKKLEEIIHPWVAFMVMPLFALANAGLSFSEFSWGSLFTPVVLGIIVALFIGKQIGVLAFTWILTRFKWVKLPAATGWLKLYGVALLCGIGFTMSLFLGALAFSDNSVLLAEMRLGVLIASLLSSITGAIVLWYASS